MQTRIDRAYSSQSSREGTLGEVASKEVSTYRSRPKGSKAAKTKAKGKKAASSSDDAFIEVTGSNLGKIAFLEYVNKYQIITNDTSTMSAEVKVEHLEYVAWLKQHIGMRKSTPSSDD